MAKRKAFLKIIKENGPLVLDGAFGTELERHGCNIHDELWSSKMLIENPEIIKKCTFPTWQPVQILLKVLVIKQL